MKKIIKITIVAIAVFIVNSASATKIEVIGFYIQSSTSTTPDGSHSTVSITCGLVSSDVCYTIERAMATGGVGIEPQVQNGPLDKENYYSSISIANGERYEGEFFAHYQQTVLGEIGLNVVHKLMYR
jgi:hypothetical protein